MVSCVTYGSQAKPTKSPQRQEHEQLFQHVHAMAKLQQQQNCCDRQPRQLPFSPLCLRLSFRRAPCSADSERSARPRMSFTASSNWTEPTTPTPPPPPPPSPPLLSSAPDVPVRGSSSRSSSPAMRRSILAACAAMPGDGAAPARACRKEYTCC